MSEISRNPQRSLVRELRARRDTLPDGDHIEAGVYPTIQPRRVCRTLQECDIQCLDFYEAELPRLDKGRCHPLDSKGRQRSQPTIDLVRAGRAPDQHQVQSADEALVIATTADKAMSAPAELRGGENACHDLLLSAALLQLSHPGIQAARLRISAEQA